MNVIMFIIGLLVGAITLAGIITIVKTPLILHKTIRTIPTSAFQVVVIDDTAEELAAGLGITDDRCTELRKIVENTINEVSASDDGNNTHWGKVIETIMPKLAHQNEAAWVIYEIGHATGHVCERKRNPIAAIINGITGG
jgi:hypothetical protein